MYTRVMRQKNNGSMLMTVCGWKSFDICVTLQEKRIGTRLDVLSSLCLLRQPNGRCIRFIWICDESPKKKDYLKKKKRKGGFCRVRERSKRKRDNNAQLKEREKLGWHSRKTGVRTPARMNKSRLDPNPIFASCPISVCKFVSCWWTSKTTRLYPKQQKPTRWLMDWSKGTSHGHVTQALNQQKNATSIDLPEISRSTTSSQQCTLEISKWCWIVTYLMSSSIEKPTRNSRVSSYLYIDEEVIP